MIKYFYDDVDEEKCKRVRAIVWLGIEHSFNCVVIYE